MLEIKLKYLWLIDAKYNSLLVEFYFHFMENIQQDLLQRFRVLKNVKKISSKTINSGRYYDYISNLAFALKTLAAYLALTSICEIDWVSP